MNILMITPGAAGFKSPSVYVAEELRRRGHHVYLVINGNNPLVTVELPEVPDVIFGDMERACIPAHINSLIYDAPCYLHGEWIPKFRVETTKEWGEHLEIEDKKTLSDWRSFYLPIASAMHHADVCSWASPIFQTYAEGFTGKEYQNAFTRFTRLPPDAPDEAASYDCAENAVTICSRLAPIKRVPMLVRALTMLPDGIRPKRVYIVGGGDSDIQEIINILDGSGIVPEFAGPVGGEQKWDYIKRGRLLLSAWTGIPPGEALMCGRPTVAFDYEHIRELYDDTLIYTPNNDLEALTETLKTQLIRSDRDLHTFALGGRERLLSGQIGLQTFESGVNEIEQVLESIRR